MSSSIPSSDVLAICLVLSDYDLDMSVAKVLQRVERYQELQGWHFGTGETDFRSAFYRLAIELGICGYAGWEELPDLLDKIPLREWVEPILRHNDLYCNDEGEYWSTGNEFSRGSEFDYSEHNRPMRDLFADPVSVSREEIRRLASAGFNEAMYH